MNSDFIIHFNSLSGIEGLIYKNYCATEQCLFSTEAATKCDAIRTELDNLYETKAINDDEYYQLLASLIISVDKYLKSSPNNNYFLLELLPTVDGERGETYNYDPNYLIDFIEGNALYLDPPFNYHPEHINNLILENIANYDNFISLNQSCQTSAPNFAFVLNNLISNAKFDYIFVRQNNEVTISFDTLKFILSDYGQYTSYAFPSMSGNSFCAEFLHCLRRA